MKEPATIFAQRLRAARERAELTQEKMASLAGLDEFSASARISQYETGKHLPRRPTAVALAKVLRVPVEYFYAEDDRTAELLLLWGRLSIPQRKSILDAMRDLESVR